MTDNDNAPLFSIKNRRLYIDSDEHGFSSGKLVGHAFSDQTERQVNAFANGLGRFRHAVAPVVLSRAVHDQQASGGEVEGPGVVLAGPVAETETADSAQVERQRVHLERRTNPDDAFLDGGAWGKIYPTNIPPVTEYLS